MRVLRMRVARAADSAAPTTPSAARRRRAGLVVAAATVAVLAGAPAAMADTVVASGTQAADANSHWCVGEYNGSRVTVAQSFVPSTTGKASSATVLLRKIGTSQGTVTVALTKASGGFPQGPALATGTAPATSPTGVRTYTVTFATPATIEAGQQYALVVDSDLPYCQIGSSQKPVVSGVPGQKGSQVFQGMTYEREGFGYTVTAKGQDPPSCAGDRLSTGFDTASDLAPTCTGTGLAYTLKSGPSHGSLGAVGVDGKVRYTPNHHYYGPDSFELTATDPDGQSATDTVTVDVAKPAPPACAGDAASVDFNTPGDATFSCTGVDVTYTVKDGPAHGALSGLSGNTVRYAPNGGYTGDDLFRVTATDLAGQTATDTVHVTVGGAKDTAENSNDQLTHQVAQTQFNLPAGEQTTKTLSCPSGQVATDGHPLIQAVDQDSGTPADIEVHRSVRTSADGYTFELSNPTSGQAQGQLYVDCISSSTFLGHRLAVSGPVTGILSVPVGGAQKTLSCPDGTTAIAPGFSAPGSGLSGTATLTSSEPAANGSGWRFAFTSSAPRSVALSVSCLGYANDDRSLIRATTTTRTASIPAGSAAPRSTALDCPVGTVGTVGGFSAPSSLTFLGQESQARTRLYWLQNSSGSDQSATVSVLCVGLTTQSTSSPVTHAGDPSPEPPPAPDTAAPAVAAVGDGSGTSAPAPGGAAAPRRLATAPTMQVAPRVTATALRSGLPVSVTVPDGGATVTITATDGGKQLATVRRRAAAGKQTLKLRLTPAARRRLGRSGHRTIKVSVTVGGTTTTKVVRVTR